MNQKERRTYESVITQRMADSTYLTLFVLREVLTPVAELAKHAIIFRRRNG